ncbi:hypothetical protein RN001_005575 [Aquatica leii]|uniref:Uncharacterized protein n=1 Tax=Aquatica leii TaxID=1421715 RepID=A0AAN7SAN3_9COLE|nr:hypothetical protein RN001_005575 [Aquatica leii]
MWKIYVIIYLQASPSFMASINGRFKCNSHSQWRKTWQDKRNKTRLKKAKINNHRRGTGGGEVTTEVLTPVEEDVLCLIAPTHIEGHSGVKESTKEFYHDFKTILGDDVEIIFDKCFTPPVTSVDTSAVFNKHVVVPASTSVAPSAKEIPPTLLATQKIEDQGKKKRMAVQRLHNSLQATAVLTEAVKLKNEIKQNYYTKKIELLGKQTDAFERMATALEKLANKTTTNAHQDKAITQTMEDYEMEEVASEESQGQLLVDVADLESAEFIIEGQSSSSTNSTTHSAPFIPEMEIAQDSNMFDTPLTKTMKKRKRAADKHDNGDVTATLITAINKVTNDKTPKEGLGSVLSTFQYHGEQVKSLMEGKTATQQRQIRNRLTASNR